MKPLENLLIFPSSGKNFVHAGISQTLDFQTKVYFVFIWSQVSVQAGCGSTHSPVDPVDQDPQIAALASVNQVSDKTKLFGVSKSCQVLVLHVHALCKY